MVSLVKQRDFAAALQIIEKLPATFKKQFSFEQAYVLHRMGRNEQAAKVLLTCDPTESATQHLSAQVQYKLGDIPSSLSHYEAVLAKELTHMSEDDISDLLTNVVACGAN